MLINVIKSSCSKDIPKEDVEDLNIDKIILNYN